MEFTIGGEIPAVEISKDKKASVFAS